MSDLAYRGSAFSGSRNDEPQPRKVIVQGLDLDGLDEEHVKNVIRQELDSALGRDGGTLSQERLEALRYYHGEPFGNEVPDRSQVVMRTVLEAVEWVLPALIRIFTASDKICLIEPPPPQQDPLKPPMSLQQQMAEAEAMAKDATEYVNHIFKENQGFLLLHDWFKDALLEKLGWVKYYWDTQKRTETKSYTGLTREQYDAILGGDDEVEVVKLEKYTQKEDSFNLDRAYVPPPAPPMPMAGLPLVPPPVELYDCTLRITSEVRQVKILNVPPEEILFSRRAKRGDIRFMSHRRGWTYSDLVQQGYDEECLDLIPWDDSAEYNQERTARHREDMDWPNNPRPKGDPGAEIWVEENYAYFNVEEGGKTTELYKVVTAGDGLVILTKDGRPDVECFDEMPFVGICPIPSSHKLVGQSLADMTMDLQLIKSTLIRQMIDNAFLSNWPRVEVADDAVNENTYDDLLTLRPGGLVRTRRLGGIQPMMIPFTADKSFPLVQYLDTVAELRTGVNREGQMMTSDALNNVAASSVAMLQQSAAQRVELFARIFAHGVEELMRGVMRLVRRHQQQERIIRVTGGWLNVDPRQWRQDMPVTVSVGLGTGNRDQILQHLMQVVQLQGSIVQQQGGVGGPLVYAHNVYDALQALQENAGFKSSFFADPSKPPPPQAGPPPPPKPDPEMMKAQAKIQQEQMQAQANVQAIGVKAQAEQQLMMEKAQADAAIQQQKLEHEKQMGLLRVQHETELERQKAENALAVGMAKVKIAGEAKQREIELKYAAGAYDQRPVGPPNGQGGPLG